MSASYSALRLGFLPWHIKWRQETVWSKSWKGIKEIDDLLSEIELALLGLADKITRQFRTKLKKLLTGIERDHRKIANMNIGHFLSLLETEADRKRRRALFEEYLADETNYRFREFQKEDCNNLRDLLATLVVADNRLQGYYDIGSHLGEAIDLIKPSSGPLSKKDREYILAGRKRLPLPEQREIEPFFLPTSLNLLALAKRIEKLGRFLKDNEDDLLAKPRWDGKIITYRDKSEEVRIQDKSVMTFILDEGEQQGWPDTIRLSPKLIGNKRSVANAIQYFQREHKLLEFSVNGDRVFWGPPGTIKRRNATRKTRSV